MPWERNWPDRSPTSASASVQKIDHASRRGSLVPTESRMDGGENQVDLKIGGTEGRKYAEYRAKISALFIYQSPIE